MFVCTNAGILYSLPDTERWSGMRSRWMTVVAVGVIITSGTGLSWADISPVNVVRVGIGETIQPVQESDVRMVSEDVHITLDDSTASVSCRFEMRNEGTSKHLTAGFPDRNFGSMYDFHARVNGRDVPVRLVRRIPPEKLNGREPFPFQALFTIPFGSAESGLIVEVWYKNRFVPDIYQGLKDLRFEYILQTGSYWNGVIEDAKVTVDFGVITPGRISGISPSGYIKDGNTVTWRFTNFEPLSSRSDIRFDIIRKELYSRMAEAYFLLEENPSSARGHYLLGTILFNREDRDITYKKAERELLKAVELDPGLLDARFLLAVINCMPKERNRENESVRNAVMHLREIVKRDPEYSFRDWRLTPDIFRLTHMRGTCATEWLNTLAGGVLIRK